MWRSMWRGVESLTLLLSPMHSLSLSLILHELGRRSLKTNYKTCAAREMIFTLTGGEYNFRYFQIFVVLQYLRSSNHWQSFLQSWATEIRTFMKEALKTARMNHCQMKPSCLASLIYSGGASFIQ